MRLRRACAAALLAIAAACAAPPPTTAQSALFPYDDFSSGDIEGGRWLGYAHTVRFADLTQIDGGWNNQVENPAIRHPRFSTSNATVVRRVVGSQLQLQIESRGGTHPDPNVAPGHGRLGVSGGGSRNIVQARVTPMAAASPACRTTGESRVRAQLVADLLGTDPGYGGPDRTDVFATLSLDRSSFGGDQIYAVVSRCRDWTCNVAEDIDWIVFSRAWTLGRAHTLTIRHEPENSRVVFTVAGGGVAAETRVLR